MGLFGRPAPNPADAPPARPALRVLRADGARIDLTSRDAGQMLVATRQGWQATAWAYRDMIGELRYAHRLLSRAVARARFYPAATRPGTDDLVDLTAPELPDDLGLDPQLIADAVHNFGRIPFDANPDGFTARATENVAVAGEFWVHIDADERFHIRSTSEINASADGRITINGLPTATQGSTRVIDPQREDLLRCWVPHPEWGQLADSAMRTLLDVAEDVVLAGREQRAAARSRLAANGLLLIPDTMSMVRARDDDEDKDDSVKSDRFLADFTAAMLAPIRDDGDAQAVVPIVLRGDKEDLEKVRHVTLSRADAEKLIARQGAAILRLLKGVDVQPEQVDGVGGMNHWGAWQVDSRAIKDQVEPAGETLAACFAAAFLRPALGTLSHPAGQVSRITIGVDVSGLAENPNRGQDARDAHAALVISDAALRRDLGYDDEDAPDQQEWVRRLAATGRLPVDATAAVIGIGRAAQPQPQIVNAGPVPQQQLPAADAPDGRAAPEQPDVSRGPTSTEPATPSGSAAARVVPFRARPEPVDPDPFGFAVDPDLSRRLGDIDAALLDRIVTAADAALARVVERAGSRVRSAAQRDRAVAASLVGIDASLVPARLGRARVEEFTPVTELLDDSYARLRDQVRGWLAAAADQVAAAVLRLLRLDRDSARGRKVAQAVTVRLASRVEPALQQLDAVLDAAAERALFAPDPFRPDADLPGEQVTTLVRPREVVDVLAVAGGSSPVLDRPAPVHAAPAGPTGFGTGPVVTDLMADEGAVLLGFEWQYRPEIPRNEFGPHRALDRVRFATFTDPKLDTDPHTAWLGAFFRPQDHDGCLCRTVPIWAVPELDDGIVARRLREAAGNPRNVLAGQVAAEDTAAGRVGTSLQNESEVRDRIVAAVDRMQREHIERGAS